MKSFFHDRLVAKDGLIISIVFNDNKELIPLSKNQYPFLISRYIRISTRRDGIDNPELVLNYFMLYFIRLSAKTQINEDLLKEIPQF